MKKNSFLHTPGLSYASLQATANQNICIEVLTYMHVQTVSKKTIHTTSNNIFAIVEQGGDNK